MLYLIHITPLNYHITSIINSLLLPRFKKYIILINNKNVVEICYYLVINLKLYVIQLYIFIVSFPLY